MTEYTDQDTLDSFMYSAVLGDPEPTTQQLQEFLDKCMQRYGKHPIEVDIRIVDELVQEILYPEERKCWTDYKY